jgi:hypothetical protein
MDLEVAELARSNARHHAMPRPRAAFMRGHVHARSEAVPTMATGPMRPVQ